MTLSAPPPWLLTIEAGRAGLEAALADDLGVPVTIACDAVRAVVVATVDEPLDDRQLEELLDSLAPMWPDMLAPWRIGLEVRTGDGAGTWDAGEMAVRAAGAGG